MLTRIVLCTFVVISVLSGRCSTVGAQPIGEAVGAAQAGSQKLPSVWNLAIQGGWFMIPIAAASVIAVAFTLERLYGLRRGRVLARPVVTSLRELLATSSVEPRRLWQCCARDRSPLARIIKAAVLKTGRPQNELEAAVVDAVGRETADMSRNLRPINVVASVAPLLGLLGTVQGMILAFMVTSTTSSTGTAKAQELAHGIYTALVTTFAGLCVAVVAVVLANFLEGKIQKRLKELEQIFLKLLPRLETWEGRIRIQESTDTADEIRVLKIQRPAEPAAKASKNAAGAAGGPRRIVRAAGASGSADSDSTGSGERSGRRSSAAQPVAAADSAAGSSIQTLRSNFNR